MSFNAKAIGLTLAYDLAEKIPLALDNAESSCDDMTLNYVKEMNCYRHFGFFVPEERFSRLNVKAIEWVVSYFEKGDTREIVGGWFHPLSYGMLICLLANQQNALRAICSWAKPNARPEYKGSLVAEVQQLYLVVAAQFHDDPSSSFTSLFEKIRKSRKSEVKLHVKLATAVIDRDEASFSSAIEEAVQRFQKMEKPDPEGYFMEDWLPLHLNTIYLAGLALGIAKPAIEPGLQAYLMTPESVAG